MGQFVDQPGWLKLKELQLKKLKANLKSIKEQQNLFFWFLLKFIWKYWELYQKHIKMSDINCFFFSSSSLKNSYVTKAMKRFFALNKKKIIQFIYQSF